MEPPASEIAAGAPAPILPDPAAFGSAYLDEFTRVLDTYLTASPAAVLEWGAGHTTWQLLARLDRIGCRLFVTVEDWPDYLDEILREVRPRPWFRAILEDRVGPKVDQFDPELTYSTRVLQLETRFDFIYIDGRRRMECALVAALLAHEDTIVVIHDYRRGRYQPIRALFDILEDGPQFRVMKARPELVRLFDERRREIMTDMRAASPGQIAAFVDHPDVGGQR
jgi:hypothetical protein